MIINGQQRNKIQEVYIQTSGNSREGGLNPSKLFPYFESHQSIQKYSKNLGVRGD